MLRFAERDKKNNLTVKKSLKWRSKLAMKNRVRNVTMEKDNRNALAHFT